MKPPLVIHGFTLLELLVVIAIIAMLAALLLPVLGKVSFHTRGNGLWSTKERRQNRC